MEEIKGYEGLYSITKDGKVWSHHKRYGRGNPLRKGRWLKHSHDGMGYPQVVLSKNNKPKTARIHRLIAIAYISNPLNKPETNHRNGIKTDNRVENLEWVTHKENLIHAEQLGLVNHVKGESNGNSKLTMKQVKELRENHKNRERGEKMWERYNIDRSNYYRIIRGEIWKT